MIEILRKQTPAIVFLGVLFGFVLLSVDNDGIVTAFHDKTFNAQSDTTCLVHSDLFTVLNC